MCRHFQLNKKIKTPNFGNCVAKMPKIVDLRPDRNLICNNFDGYKLSLDPVPILREELKAAPHKAIPDEEQYSLLHAELFSMQNLLQVDPWARTSTYFVNRLGEVVHSCYNENSGRPEALQVVFRVGDECGAGKHSKGDYNYSLRFISEKYCVLCDGLQQLLLLDTGDRLKASEWKLVAQTRISAAGDEHGFRLYDARLDIIQEQKQISLALGRVQRVDTVDGSSSHYMHLHWAKWIYDDAWVFTILDTLEGKGSLYYCGFEPRAESLIISSNHSYHFRSEKAKMQAPKPGVEMEKLQLLHDDAGAVIGGFSWVQSEDDITIKFDTKPDRERTDYNIKHATDQLTVKCGDETLLDSALYAKVDQDLTTWTIENNFLQITLIKENTKIYWPSLLPNGAGPKETLDDDTPSCLPVEQKPIANLEAPIEDCDFPVGTIEEEIKIDRFNLASKSITHSVLLGSTPPLFTTNLRPGFPLALATRQDVDASLWLQQYNPSKPEEWSLRHEGNLHAFGYVQASKQQRKFIDCSPDLNYALICESHRHVFLYKSSYDGANGLRNRNGPQVSLGKQHLVTLDDVGEVLGIATAPSMVTLLTERYILYLQIS